MNCTETQKNIEALLDGELDDAQRDVVEHHLWMCPPCLELRERTASLSKLLRAAEAAAAPAALDRWVMRSFEEQHRAKKSSRRRAFFDGLRVPKPIFAAFLMAAAAAALWLAFQIGKISASSVSMTAPEIVVNQIAPPEPKTRTVAVEVPIIREKIVTRTVYVRARKSVETEKSTSLDRLRRNDSPLYSSTVAENNYLTDVNLQGFEPSAEIGAKIIKGVKENEKYEKSTLR